MPENPVSETEEIQKWVAKATPEQLAEQFRQIDVFLSHIGHGQAFPRMLECVLFLRAASPLAVKMREIEQREKDEIEPPFRCPSRASGEIGPQCVEDSGHQDFRHRAEGVTWNDPQRVCWSGPTYSHAPHRWVEDRPGGNMYWCPGATYDRT